MKRSSSQSRTQKLWRSGIQFAVERAKSLLEEDIEDEQRLDRPDRRAGTKLKESEKARRDKRVLKISFGRVEAGSSKRKATCLSGSSRERQQPNERIGPCFQISVYVYLLQFLLFTIVDMFCCELTFPLIVYTQNYLCFTLRMCLSVAEHTAKFSIILA